MTRVLVTGVDGQVGRALLAADAAPFDFLPMRRNDLDLSQPGRIADILTAHNPSIIVNCAAYTAVDRAESERDLAFTVNGAAPGAIAAWCAEAARPLIHLSTDYVFAGDGTRPYRESDPIAPVSAYGASKAEGEKRIAAEGGAAIILRTAWVYDGSGQNFLRTMLRLGAERDHLRVVSDQRGCPTASVNIAAAIVKILREIQQGDAAALAGIYHYVDAGETSWHGFAEAIFDLAAKKWGRRPQVAAIKTEEYPTPARRPHYSVLDTNKIQAAFAVAPPDWRDSLGQVMAAIA